jgi:hypothetical protein
VEVNYRTATKKSEAAAAAAAAATVTSLGTLSKGSTAGSHDESAPGSNGSTFEHTARPQVNYSLTSRRKNNYPVAAAAGRSKFAVNNQLAKGTIGPGSGTPSPGHNSIPVKMKGRWH